MMVDCINTGAGDLKKVEEILEKYGKFNARFAFEIMAKNPSPLFSAVIIRSDLPLLIR